MADALRLHVEPTRVDIKPGGDAAVLTARVYNATRIVDEFHVAVIGTGQWLDAQPARVRLFPDTDGSVEVEILIPKDRQVNVIEVVSGEGIKLDPSVVHGGQDGEMIATVRNGANVPMNVVMMGEDPEREVAFTFEPTAVAIPPGGEGWSRVRFSAKRPFSGEDRNRQLVVRAEGGHTPLAASATFIQKPTITRFRLYLLRVLVTLLGAGLMVVGAFLTWTGGLRGTEFTIPAFLHLALSQTGEPPSIEGAMQFFTSCGLGIIVLAVVSALGILTARARLTKLGAGLGLVLLIGFIVVMASKGAGVDLGVFVSLFGCLVALAAGFMGTSKR